jgi:hypothetical protein
MLVRRVLGGGMLPRPGLDGWLLARPGLDGWLLARPELDGGTLTARGSDVAAGGFPVGSLLSDIRRPRTKVPWRPSRAA